MSQLALTTNLRMAPDLIGVDMGGSGKARNANETMQLVVIRMKPLKISKSLRFS